jgi:hypothetical protein
MTVQCSAVMEKIIGRQQDKLCNIENLMARRQDNALQFWKSYGWPTGQCSALLENAMAKRQDNALQY